MIKRILEKLKPKKIAGHYLYIVELKDKEFHNAARVNVSMHKFDHNNLSGIERIDRHISKKKICYLMMDQGRIVNENWVYLWSPLVYQLGYRDTCAIGDSFTQPDYRGKGLYATMISYILADLSKNKICKYGAAFVRVDNDPPNITLPKLGFERIRELTGYTFLGIYFK